MAGLVQRDNRLFEVGNTLSDDPECCYCAPKTCVILEGIPEGSGEPILPDCDQCFPPPYWPNDSDTWKQWVLIAVWYIHDGDENGNNIGDAVPFLYFESCCGGDDSLLEEAVNNWYEAQGGSADAFITFNCNSLSDPADGDACREEISKGCPICIDKIAPFTEDDILTQLVWHCRRPHLDCWVDQ